MYWLAGFIADRSAPVMKWCNWNTRLHRTIDETCGACASDLILVATHDVAADEYIYAWVDRRTREGLGIMGQDRDAVEMAGYMLAGK